MAGDSGAAFRDKLRSLSFVGRPTTRKVTVNETGTCVVTTTEQAERQDVHVRVLDVARGERERDDHG